jgi:hypothetical protein
VTGKGKDPSPQVPRAPSPRGGKVVTGDLDLDELLAEPSVAQEVTARGFDRRQARAIAEAWQAYRQGDAKPRTAWLRSLASWIHNEKQPPEFSPERFPCPRCKQLKPECGPDRLCTVCRITTEQEQALAQRREQDAARARGEAA